MGVLKGMGPIWKKSSTKIQKVLATKKEKTGSEREKKEMQRQASSR